MRGFFHRFSYLMVGENTGLLKNPYDVGLEIRKSLVYQTYLLEIIIQPIDDQIRQFWFTLKHVQSMTSTLVHN